MITVYHFSQVLLHDLHILLNCIFFIGLRKASESTINAMVDRLTADSKDKAPDANRTGANKEMGIFNSFACKGW